MRLLDLRILTLLMGMILINSACTRKSDPKDVAIKFLNARNKMDYETAKKYGTPATDTTMDWLAERTKDIPKEVAELTKNTKVEVVGEPLITGNTASLKVMNTIGTTVKEEIIMLHKADDGIWYVDDNLFDYNQSIVTPESEDSTGNEATVEVDNPAQMPKTEPQH